MGDGGGLLLHGKCRNRNTCSDGDELWVGDVLWYGVDGQTRALLLGDGTHR